MALVTMSATLALSLSEIADARRYMSVIGAIEILLITQFWVKTTQ